MAALRGGHLLALRGQQLSLGDHLTADAILAVCNENVASGNGHVIGVIVSVCRFAVLKRYALVGGSLGISWYLWSAMVRAGSIEQSSKAGLLNWTAPYGFKLFKISTSQGNLKTMRICWRACWLRVIAITQKNDKVSSELEKMIRTWVCHECLQKLPGELRSPRKSELRNGSTR